MTIEELRAVKIRNWVRVVKLSAVLVMAVIAILWLIRKLMTGL